MQLAADDDISIILTSTFMKFTGLWLAANEAEQRRRNIMLFYTMFLLVFGAWVLVVDFCHCWRNFSDVLYIICNMLSVLIVLIKFIVIITRRVEFTDLIQYMQTHFWTVSYDYHEKVILIDSKKMCILFTSIVTFSGHCAFFSYLATPLIENAGKNESERILPFNLWLGLPTAMTPYYEIAFSIQTLALYQTGMCYFSFDNLFCIMSIHVSGQFRILQYRLTKLCDPKEIKDQNENIDLVFYSNKCSTKLKNYIRLHQSLIDYCAKLEHVFTKIVLGQVLVFSMLICLFGYQILLVNEGFGKRCIFVFLMLCSISMLFMFTYSCHSIMEQSDNVGTAAYSASWTLMPMNKAGKMIRSDLLLMMLRSKRVCCLTANGFFSVSLETYTTILSTAVSYFTLLSTSYEAI